MVIYNIPVHLVQAHPGWRVVVRVGDGTEALRWLSEADVDRIAFVQIRSPTAARELQRWGPGVPIDLVMERPSTDYPSLYEYAELGREHPLRVSMPTEPGFLRAVKLAAALNIAAKLEIGQPDPAEIEEMARVADLYLHQTTAAQPIEYFHGVLMALYHGGAPTTLWAIQEEDPASYRHVDDTGTEVPSRRLPANEGPRGAGMVSVAQLGQELAAEDGECRNCDFLELCCGFFKHPRKDYSCNGVRSIFQTLAGAARELRADLAAAANGADGPR